MVIDIRLDDIDPNTTVEELAKMYAGFRIYIPFNFIKTKEMKRMELDLKRISVSKDNRNKRIAESFDLSVRYVSYLRKKGFFNEDRNQS